jgi:hypothetical protein
MPNGKKMSSTESCTVLEDKIKVERKVGGRTQSKDVPLPEGEFFFAPAYLLMLVDVHKLETFARREINPQTGEVKVNVIKPAKNPDGGVSIGVHEEGLKLDESFVFDKDGKLTAASESGLPFAMKVVDEKRGKELIEQFKKPKDQPETRPAARTQPATRSQSR